MKKDIPAKFLFILLMFHGKINARIFATKVDIWDRIDSTIGNTSTFSLQCQDQMVKIGSNIYHLDRLRTSLKSGHFEKLFTSDLFKQNNGSILEMQLKNGDVFPAVIDLICGKEFINVLDIGNYFPLLETMNHLKMEIDLETVSSFMKENLESFSLQDAKICELYKFIRKNSNFEYLLENVFKHFANNLLTLQNHTIFPFMPLDHLIRVINKVKHPDDKKRFEIFQLCTEWLCRDMENRLFHMAKLVFNIESAFHSSAETSTGFLIRLPKCNVDEKTKRKIISRCLFALLANKNLDYKILDKLIPVSNVKLFSQWDSKIFALYDIAKNDSKKEFMLGSVLEHFAHNLTMLQSHNIFPSLSYDHLIQIIRNIRDPDDEKRYEIIQMCTEWICHDFENRLPHLANLVISAKSLFHHSIKTNTDLNQRLPRCHFDERVKREIISKCLVALLSDGEQLSPKILTDDESNYHSDDGYDTDKGKMISCNERECMRFINRNDECAKLKKFLKNSEFYDIVVRVRENPFKLHRIFLESKSNYFRDIFKAEYAEASTHCDGERSCPSKDNEYILSDEIDPSVFDRVLDYIYFDSDIFNALAEKINLFKTADILGIEEVLKKCKNHLMDNYQQISSQNTVEVLKFTYGKSKYEDLYFIYLCKHIITEWPEIYNVSHFGSISWIMLENVLRSPHFHLYNLDPDKILDLFSKWICHDASNRIHLLPRIAQIINPYCEVDHNEFKSNIAKESQDFSLQFVRDKLYQILYHHYRIWRIPKNCQRN